MPSDEISIYEVETGIHFDVPEKGLINGDRVETFPPQPE
ncbi:hypothetical protein M2321_002649 [Rhodoblastus acidophilus]|nr:hypothetical protein [Rhodoblastus acidophilus]